jgi:organic radical activating enzyme
MKNIINKYKNGSYEISIFNDGTLIRKELDNKKIVEHPTSIDLKVTNFCSLSSFCKWCHENSDKSGKHAILEDYYFILEQLPAGAELAIGGGNPLDHPNLITFLEKAKKEGIICNITVNELHLKKFKNLITKLVNEDLIKGLGITYSGKQKKELEYFSKLTNNLVFHVIMGVHELSCLDEIQKYSNKVLILGYKEFRKGKDFYSEEVENKKYKWYTRLPIYFNKMTLSFDNLAIEQLNLKRWLTNESWNKFYMGDDSTFTMYIDAVENKFACSSTHKERFSVEPDIRKIFNKIKKEVI